MPATNSNPTTTNTTCSARCRIIVSSCADTDPGESAGTRRSVVGNVTLIAGDRSTTRAKKTNPFGPVCASVSEFSVELRCTMYHYLFPDLKAHCVFADLQRT